MNRRGFFGLLAGAAAAPFVPIPGPAVGGIVATGYWRVGEIPCEGVITHAQAARLGEILSARRIAYLEHIGEELRSVDYALAS